MSAPTTAARLLAKADELDVRADKIRQTRHSSRATKHRRQAQLIRTLLKEHAPEPDLTRYTLPAVGGPHGVQVPDPDAVPTPVLACRRCDTLDPWPCRTITALEVCFIPEGDRG